MAERGGGWGNRALQAAQAMRPLLRASWREVAIAPGICYKPPRRQPCPAPLAFMDPEQERPRNMDHALPRTEAQPARLRLHGEEAIPPLRLVLQPSGMVLEVCRPEAVIGRHSDAD